MTEVLITSKEDFAAYKDIFHKLALVAKTESADLELEKTAKTILGYSEKARSMYGISYTARADVAMELLGMLPTYEGRPTALDHTRALLWKTICVGLSSAGEDEEERACEKVCARALLDTPLYGASWPYTHVGLGLNKTFQAVIIEQFKLFHSNSLVRLLSYANGGDNEIVIRKAWQSLGAHAPIEMLLSLRKHLLEEVK